MEAAMMAEAVKDPSIFQQMEILILFIVVIFKTQIGMFFGWLKSLITKEKNRSLNDRLESIEKAIKKLFAVVDKHGTCLEEREINDLKNTLFSEDRDAYSQLQAFVVLTSKKINGRVPARGLEKAMQNKETWLNIYDWMQSAIKEGKLEITNQTYFEETIKMIHQKINDQLLYRKNKE
jgi:hypothetical protein